MADRVGREQIKIAKSVNLPEFIKSEYGEELLTKDGNNVCMADATYIKLFEKNGEWKYKNWCKGDSGDSITFLQKYCEVEKFQDAVRKLYEYYFANLEIENDTGLPFN